MKERKRKKNLELGFIQPRKVKKQKTKNTTVETSMAYSQPYSLCIEAASSKPISHMGLGNVVSEISWMPDLSSLSPSQQISWACYRTLAQ